MFDWKIILTIIIALGIVLTYLGSNPAVSGFFDSVRDRLPFSADVTARNVEFTLTAGKYSDMEFSVNNANFTITGYSEATLKTGNLRTNKTLGIYGFRGSGSIRGNTLTLDGRMSKVELPEITVAIQETIKSNSTFTSLSITNLGVKEIKIENTSGTLTVRGTTTQFSGDVVVVAPLGDFFFANNTIFKLSGKANKVSIPSAGISIE